MKSVQNKTNAPLEVPGYPLFAPKEVREVSDEDAAILGDSQNIAVLRETAAANEDSPKPAKKRPASD